MRIHVHEKQSFARLLYGFCVSGFCVSDLRGVVRLFTASAPYVPPPYETDSVQKDSSVEQDKPISW